MVSERVTSPVCAGLAGIRCSPGWTRTNNPPFKPQRLTQRLRRENAELDRTNEILKATSSLFAQEADPSRRRY